MSEQVETLLSPFIERGLFDSPEQAVIMLARDYTLHQIERHQTVIEQLQKNMGCLMNNLMHIWLRAQQRW